MAPEPLFRHPLELGGQMYEENPSLQMAGATVFPVAPEESQ